MNALAELDTQLFLFLNRLHFDWLDGPMVAITQMWIWIPVYVLLIVWAIRLYGKRNWWFFLSLIILLLCSDQLSSHVCKPLFQRLRPCYNPNLQSLIYLPNGLAGGRFGFVSSHAANTFSVATFLTLIFRKHHPNAAFILYSWAFLSSYSRIYMGYHYPGDIIAGAFLGILVGFLVWKLQQKIEPRLWKSEQRS